MHSEVILFPRNDNLQHPIKNEMEELIIFFKHRIASILKLTYKFSINLISPLTSAEQRHIKDESPKQYNKMEEFFKHVKANANWACLPWIQQMFWRWPWRTFVWTCLESWPDINNIIPPFCGVRSDWKRVDNSGLQTNLLSGYSKLSEDTHDHNMALSILLAHVWSTTGCSPSYSFHPPLQENSK